MAEDWRAGRIRSWWWGGPGLDRTLFNQRSHAFSLGILKLLKELTQNVLLLKKKKCLQSTSWHSEDHDWIQLVMRRDVSLTDEGASPKHLCSEEHLC